MTDVATTQHLAIVYLVYAAASIGLTYWLARTLFRSGVVFLDDIFSDNPRLAAAVNQLLVVGFYLLNLGYALMTLKTGRVTLTPIEAIEILAGKLGALMLALGVIHFGNLYLFHRLRGRAQIRLAPPPVKPQLHRGASNGAPTAADA
jgi:hypothetical protein